MKISGFGMCRNADSLYYPVVESVKSALPLVDEFVMAVGKGDPEDRTLELLSQIDDPKLRIVETEWDLNKYPNGTVNAQQTDWAKSHCTGDWLLYLQADEVLHEADLPGIRSACERHIEHREVEGFLFHYLHFWGDYQHLQDAHKWYNKEVRIIRNDPDIHSWQSAQGFRRIPGFDGRNYRQSKGAEKLGVKLLDARVYHYGWVRPAHLMSKKINHLDRIHSHRQERQHGPFGFGDLNKLRRFEGTHPAVMHGRIQGMDWEVNTGPVPRYFKHLRWHSRLLTWIEQRFIPGKRIFGVKNYRRLR